MSTRPYGTASEKATDASQCGPKGLPTLGARPIQMPDLRDPRVLARIRRQDALLAQHPENDAIDAWIEAVYDSNEWKRSAVIRAGGEGEDRRC
jgi:Antitoxin MazE-like